jgi:hypothetical protein
MGWSSIKNGELLALAATQFAAFVTIDLYLSFQQNPKSAVNRGHRPSREDKQASRPSTADVAAASGAGEAARGEFTHIGR